MAHLRDNDSCQSNSLFLLPAQGCLPPGHFWACLHASYDQKASHRAVTLEHTFFIIDLVFYAPLIISSVLPPSVQTCFIISLYDTSSRKLFLLFMAS